MGTTPAELMSLKDSNPKAYESAFVKPLFKQYTYSKYIRLNRSH